ncbi:hypothetical protein NMQ03_09480 [Arthrobacter sp. DNA4]|uniref:hypothetical protein n=1 Tax=Arthrobacter sp. DNA4 TaxID=2963432 RepID=UPI0020CC57D2|nr:hypothetical protein [Arthrobacter sp. DNA4]UTT71285.1 hypothetical protein NMQ03_09480 [Arthrobacter sp. DNA4]
MAGKDTSRSPLLMLKVAYERLRLPLVYASIAIVVAVLYLDSFLGPVKDGLLPAAIGVLLAFGIQSLQNLEKQGLESFTGAYTTALEAVPELSKYVEHDREVTDIHVIAATGWTTVRQVLPTICKASSAKRIRITLNVVDNAGPFADVYPGHWGTEVDHTLQRVREQFSDPRYEVVVNAYSYLPAVHGILLNNEYLLLGFFGWDTASGRPELSGAERPHRLYRRRDTTSTQLFEVFDAWFDHGPQRQIAAIHAADPAG